VVFLLSFSFSLLLKKYLVHFSLEQLDISGPKKFPWSTYANFVYKNQIRIINWPEDLPAPGSGFTNVVQAFSKTKTRSTLIAKRIEEFVWLTEAWARGEDVSEAPEEISKNALRVVSWTDGE
jgi:hypothetical protein